MPNSGEGGGRSSGGGGLSTLYSSVADIKTYDQEQGLQDESSAVSSHPRKKAIAGKSSSNWLLSAPKSAPHKIAAAFFTNNNNKDKNGTGKTSNSHLKKETLSKPAAIIATQQPTSVSSSTKQPRRAILNRDGQVTLTGQQAHFGRRAASTHGISESYDNHEDFNDSTRIMHDYNGSTRGLYTSISSGLEATVSDKEDDKLADQQDNYKSTDLCDEDDATAAAVDDSKSMLVSKDAASITLSGEVARKQRVLNRGGQVSPQVYFGRRSASMQNVLCSYDTILADFADSARVVFSGDDENESIVSKDEASITLIEAAVAAGNPKMLNCGGQVGGPATICEQAYFGRPSASAQNILENYRTILDDFADSARVLDDDNKSMISKDSSITMSEPAILSRGGQ
jgi:hypothetical protein